MTTMTTIKELRKRLEGSERLSAEFRETADWAERAEAAATALAAVLADAPTTLTGQCVAERLSGVVQVAQEVLKEVQMARKFAAVNATGLADHIKRVEAALRAVPLTAKQLAQIIDGPMDASPQGGI